MRFVKYFLLGAAIGLGIVLFAHHWFLLLCFIIAVAMFMDWSGDGDGRQRRWDE